MSPPVDSRTSRDRRKGPRCGRAIWLLAPLLAACAASRGGLEKEAAPPAPPAPAVWEEDERATSTVRVGTDEEVLERERKEEDIGGMVIVDRRSEAEMYFHHWGTNPTIDTREEPRSSFGVDVDVASYAVARSYLERGRLPAEAAIRPEELINRFDYGYEPPAPAEGPFALYAEAFPSPTRPGYHVLHLGIEARSVAPDARSPANLVFLVDVSGSMGRERRLEIVKRSLERLLSRLDGRDRVAIVAFRAEPTLVLPPTRGDDTQTIREAVAALGPSGTSNLRAGLELAWGVAGASMAMGGEAAATAQVVLCSDSGAGPGAAELPSRVAEQAARGIRLTVVGVGREGYNDALMGQLARSGEGLYAWIDRPAEMERLFGAALAGTLELVARDVKLQVQLDPAVVARYRLIGYESRLIAPRGFADERVDGGELGAGHSVTALYEVKLRGDGDPGVLRIRYRDPAGGPSRQQELVIPASVIRPDAARASAGARLSHVVAVFAEKLRRSYWVRGVSYERLIELFGGLEPAIRARPEVAELGRLIAWAAELDDRGDKFADDGPIAAMGFDRVPVLR